MPASYRWPWQAPVTAAPAPDTSSQRLTFSASIDDPYAIISVDQAIAREADREWGRVTREYAFAVPAIALAKQRLPEVLGTLPAQEFDSNAQRVRRPLLDWLESVQGYTSGHTQTATLVDLWCDHQALWMVVQRDAAGTIVAVERINYWDWTRDRTTGKIEVRGREMQPEQVVWFGMPGEGILTHGARTIRMLRRLEAAAKLHNLTPELMEYYQATTELDMTNDEIDEWIARYRSRRAAGATDVLPHGIERKTVNGHTSEEMQHIQQREFAISEVARLTGVSASWLSLNITSRTYNNSQDERRDFLDFPAAPLINAYEKRLSQDDICANGHYIKLNVDAFLRGNTKERYEAHEIALRAGFMTVNEVRALEDLPPLNDSPAVTPNA